MERVGFPRALTREAIPLTTTIHISGLHDAACFLTTPGFTPPILAMHAGSLPTGWLGVRRVGFEPSAAGSHPLGHDNEFPRLPPNPLVSGFLGATRPWLDGVIGIIRPIVILAKFQGSHTIGKDSTKRLQSLQQPRVLFRPLRGPRRYQRKICGKEDGAAITVSRWARIQSQTTRRCAVYDVIR
jgi:hypothetical protein